MGLSGSDLKLPKIDSIGGVAIRLKIKFCNIKVNYKF